MIGEGKCTKFNQYSKCCVMGPDDRDDGICSGCFLTGEFHDDGASSFARCIPMFRRGKTSRQGATHFSRFDRARGFLLWLFMMIGFEAFVDKEEFMVFVGEGRLSMADVIRESRPIWDKTTEMERGGVQMKILRLFNAAKKKLFERPQKRNKT